MKQHVRRRMNQRFTRGGYTITELLIVIAVITILLGVLLPSLAGVWSAGEMTKSMNNMRQIALYMQQYSGDNGDYIVPSRFNYAESTYPGKVRSVIATQPDGGTLGVPHSGTWADILQTVHEVGVYPDALTALGSDYRYDSPDKALYDLLEVKAISNPFRSVASNSKVPADFAGIDPTPYGRGAAADRENSEAGYPGFFAANDFFSAGWTTGPNEGEWFTNGQIRAPDRSMYLVDSAYGETIDDGPWSYDATGDPPTIEVDFRYSGDLCLMLFLDGHIDDQGLFDDLDELKERNVKVLNLTSR